MSKPNDRGLRFDRVFSSPDAHPFNQVAWTTTRAEIKDDRGAVLFAQPVTAPEGWTDQARKIVASRYFYGEHDTPGREEHVGAMVARVVREIGDWGEAHDTFATAEDGLAFRDELTWLLLHQHGAFNSPVWFNVGVRAERSSGFVWDDGLGCVRPVEDGEHRPQCSACFIQSVDDSMESIMALATSEAMLFKRGSGTGTDLSTLRSRREKLSGGGRPSGPLSFMKVYDAIAGVVKSGGKTRRAAKMQTLSCEHPDILDFIGAKATEDRKAQALRRFAGASAGVDGDAAASVAYQNANLSVRASDGFMRKVTGEDPVDNYATVAVTTGEPVDVLSAGMVMDRIAQATLDCGDPGIQFDGTINAWHTCPADGRINSSNPCAEFVYLDDTSCNLASLNLMRFRRDDGTFDVERFRAACRVFFVAQEILVDFSSYPTARIAGNSHRFRPLGLGYCNLGALLMVSGLPYDSVEGRHLAGAITSLMQAKCGLTTAELAVALGPFDGFEANREPFLKVMGRHARHAYDLFWDTDCDTEAERIAGHAKSAWRNTLAAIEAHGARNAQFTVLAPTGTIAFMMDAATTGIEPDIALVKYKSLAGGGTLKIVNPLVGEALANLGYDAGRVEAILAYVEAFGMVEGCDHVDAEHLPIFDCAFPARPGGRCIAPEGHLGMMAAAQPSLSGAISKTVNLPRGSTVETVRNTYIDAWKLGIKAVAIYVDGSKESQVVSTTEGGFVNAAAVDPFRATLEADPTVAAIVADRLRGHPAGRATAPAAAPGFDHAIARTRDAGVPCRRRLPETRPSVTHKFDIQGHEGYLTVGLDADGRPAELFVTISKSGSAIQGMVNFGVTMASLALQHGASLGTILGKMRGTRFAPSGFTGGTEVRTCTSLLDYFARWIELHFLAPAASPPVDGPREAGGAVGGDEAGNHPPRAAAVATAVLEPLAGVLTREFLDAAEIEAATPVTVGSRITPTGESCEECGSYDLVPNGKCLVCRNCGVSPGNCGG